eukprot:jgi/Botrbrau1/4910/Bobra.118_1s0023.1
MALRTLVEVPLGLRNTFTVVAPVRRIALGPFWDDTWANWAKKNPRVPDISGGLSFENCRDFAKSKLTEIRALGNAEIAVQQLVCEIGIYFTKLEPIEVHLTELTKQLNLQVAGEGGFKPGFDSVAHFAEMQRLASTKTEYVTRVWQLYFIAAELDTDSSVGRTEDRVDMLEAEVAVLNQRVAANEKETQELKALLKGKRAADGDAVPPPKRAAFGKPSGSTSGSGAGPSGTQPNAYAARMKREGRCYKCGELGHTAKFCKKPDAHDKGKGKAPAS